MKVSRPLFGTTNRVEKKKRILWNSGIIARVNIRRLNFDACEYEASLFLEKFPIIIFHFRHHLKLILKNRSYTDANLELRIQTSTTTITRRRLQ